MTKKEWWENFKKGWIGGLGWSFGVTLGFVIISTLLVIFFNILGGLPLIGTFVADIVQTTQQQLKTRSILDPGFQP